MSDIETLHNRLHRLVHGDNPTSGKIRDLMHPGSLSVRHAMRSEIAETQLLRRMVFRNDRDEEISLEVASGRVLRVSHPVSDHLRENLPEALTQSIFQSTEAEVLQLIEALQAFAFEAKKLSVETQIIRHNTSMPDVGIPVDDLLQVSDTPEQRMPKQLSINSLEAFLQDCAPISSAALLMTGDRCVLECGSEGHLDALKALALAERVSNDTHPQPQDDPGPPGQCVIYTGHPQGGQTVLCASQIPHLAFLSFHNDMLDAVLGFWASQADFGRGG